jgi:hypothetical protein
MKTNKYLFLVYAFLFVYNNLFAWTSSNEGVCYTMDTLVQLSPDISYNAIDEMYEVDCDIIILENDTLRILPGETVKFLSYPGGPPVRYEVIIYGNLKAIGEKEKIITLGDPAASFSSGHWWQGIKFINTSQNGESIIQYCDIRGAVNMQVALETSVYCENSSPIINNTIFQYIGSSEEFGGASAIGLKGQSYPMILYSTFKNIVNGVAIWCNPYDIQDTINYPSPLIIGCNVLSSVGGFYFPPSDNDHTIINGGFLDNCFLEINSIHADTSLGYPVDSVGDGICNSISTCELQQKFFKIDGVVNPRGDELITGIIEQEAYKLPTTPNYITLKTNHPNPFSNFTSIEFGVTKRKAKISLYIFDSKGHCVNKLIDHLEYQRGNHSIIWYGDYQDTSPAPIGIYFYQLYSEGQMLIKKAILIK